MFLAGDAAHIHTPAGGQGMNTGIQDAYNLAWKIAYSIEGQAKLEVLQTYHTERNSNAKQLLKTTDRIFNVMAGSNFIFNFFRIRLVPFLLTLALKNQIIRKKIFPLISQTGIRYPQSCLTAKSSIKKIKAGDRMPYFVFSNGKDVFSYLVDPVFKLLSFGETCISNSSIMTDTRLKTINFSLSEIPVFLFGTYSYLYILLRPDNHILYIGKDVQKCKEVFQKIFLM